MMILVIFDILLCIVRPIHTLEYTAVSMTHIITDHFRVLYSIYHKETLKMAARTPLMDSSTSTAYCTVNNK